MKKTFSNFSHIPQAEDIASCKKTAWSKYCKWQKIMYSSTTHQTHQTQGQVAMKNVRFFFVEQLLQESHCKMRKQEYRQRGHLFLSDLDSSIYQRASNGKQLPTVWTNRIDSLHFCLQSRAENWHQTHNQGYLGCCRTRRLEKISQSCSE